MDGRIPMIFAGLLLGGTAQAAPVTFDFDTTIGFDASSSLGLGGATSGDLFDSLFGSEVSPDGAAPLSGSITFDSASPATETNATTGSYDLAITAASLTAGATTVSADIPLITENSDQGRFNFASSPTEACLGGTDAICPGLSKTANYVGIADGIDALVEGTESFEPVFDVDALTLRIGGTPALGEFSPSFTVDGLGPVAVEYISIDLFTDSGVSILDGVALPDSSAIFETDLTRNSLFRIGFSDAETGTLFEFTSEFSGLRPGGDDQPERAVPLPGTVGMLALGLVAVGAQRLTRRPQRR